MNEKQLGEIEVRAAAARPGPWEAWDTSVCTPSPENIRVCDTDFGDEGCGEANASFIAKARTDVPALVAEVRRLKKLADAVSEAFPSIRTTTTDGGHYSELVPAESSLARWALIRALWEYRGETPAHVGAGE
jgi:hypothetical protein